MDAPLLDDEQNFYFALNNQQGYAIVNKATGETGIKQAPLRPNKISGSMLLNQGGDVYNLKDGTKSWQLSTEALPIEVCGGKFIYAYQERGQNYIVAANPQTGTAIWDTPIDNKPRMFYCPSTNEQLNMRAVNYIYTPGLISINNINSQNHMIDTNNSGIVYIFGAQSDNSMMGIDLETGDINWINDKPTDFSTLQDNAYLWLGEIENLILLSHRGFGITEAHNADDFKLVWDNGNLVIDRFLSISENHLVGVIKSANNYGDDVVLVGLDKQTGKQLWEQSFEKVKDVGLANGWVVFLQYGRDLIFLNASSGEEVARVSGDFHGSDLFDQIYEGDGFLLVSINRTNLLVFNLNND